MILCPNWVRSTSPPGHDASPYVHDYFLLYRSFYAYATMVADTYTEDEHNRELGTPSTRDLVPPTILTTYE